VGKGYYGFPNISPTLIYMNMVAGGDIGENILWFPQYLPPSPPSYYAITHDYHEILGKP
jgi:hypothetical protein